MNRRDDNIELLKLLDRARRLFEVLIGITLIYVAARLINGVLK